jgi:hypothetical protein
VENVFILLLVVLTSWIMYHATHWNHSRGAAGARDALRAFVEWVGMFSLFFTANLLVGVFVIFLIRTFTARFVALYALENTLLPILSAAQAFVFHYWWKRN